MLNRIFGRFLPGASLMQEYYSGVLGQGAVGAPTMDEACKDFHRMMRDRNPFAGV